MSYPDIGNLELVTKIGFPNFDDICRDVSSVLNGNLHPRVKQQVLDGALWWVADYSGKEFKCSFRSERANQFCMSLEPGGKIKNRGLIHEHIIPKKLIREELMALKTPVSESAVSCLLKLSVYCLVEQKDEEELNKRHYKQKMPNNNWKNAKPSSDDVWARYKLSSIKVVKVRS